MSSKKKSMGSFTLDDVIHSLNTYEQKNIMVGEPISQKIESALMRAIPWHLYPWVLETIMVDGFIRKTRALAFLDWLIVNRQNWTPDPDKVLSLHRMRVSAFCDKVAELAKPSELDLADAAFLVRAMNSAKWLNMSKKQFNMAANYISRERSIPFFAILDVIAHLVDMDYDASAAMQSTALWADYADPKTYSQPTLL